NLVTLRLESLDCQIKEGFRLELATVPLPVYLDVTSVGLRRVVLYVGVGHPCPCSRDDHRSFRFRHEEEGEEPQSSHADESPGPPGQAEAGRRDDGGRRQGHEASAR